MTEFVDEKPPVLTTGNKKSRSKTLVSLSFGYFVDQGEGQVMSVFTTTLQSLWGLTMRQIGLITFLRSILQAVSAPFWGILSDRYSRKKVILIGTGIWGIWTAILGLTQNWGQFLAIRAISGIGLGCLMPATFSLMADTFAPKDRGKALGLMEGIGILGIVICTVGLSFLATPDLWRWGFIILGLLSVISGFIIWFFVDEPVRGAAEPELAGKITKEKAAHYSFQFSHIPKIIKIPTIWVAIAQGVTGSMPWVVMGALMIAWLEKERGLDTQIAALVFAGIVIGTAFSNVIGGLLGDWADAKNPKYGRVFVGQISIIFGIPLTYVMFTQTQNWSLGALVALCFVTALLISWPGKGSKEPMMQAVVAPELRATAFAFLTAIESGFAAFIGLIVGSLTDKIGFTPAMLWTIPFPWIFCAIVYTLFYWTYPKDSAKLRQEMADRAIEMNTD